MLSSSLQHDKPEVAAFSRFECGKGLGKRI